MPIPRPREFGFWACIALVVVATCWWRMHTFAPSLVRASWPAIWPTTVGESEPLDCDEAAYAYMAHRMLAGDVLYRDLSENKPPLGYWIYGAAVGLGDYNETAIRWLPLPLVAGTIIGLGWIARRLAGPGAGILAAAIYGVVSADPYLYGNGSQLELAINLFGTWALAAWLLIDPTHFQRQALLAGLALGLASLVRQVAILPGLLFAVDLALRLRSRRDQSAPTANPDEPASSSAFWRSLLAMSAGVLLPWAIAIAILLAQGSGMAAWDEIIRHGRAIATDRIPDPNAPSVLVRWLTGNADPSGVLPPPFGSTNYLVWWAVGSLPFWILLGPSLGWCLAAGGARRFVAFWTILCWVEVALPGQYWAHYYLVLVPSASLVVAFTAADLLRNRRAAAAEHRTLPALLHTIAAGLLLLGLAAEMAWQVRQYLLVPAQELTARYKGGRQWIRDRSLGREIARRTRDWPDARLHVWGWQSTLYVYSGLDAVSPYFFVNDLLRDQADRNHPLIGPRIERLTADLERQRPALLFVSYPPFRALDQILRAGYRRSNLSPGLWIRNDLWQDFESQGAS